MRLSDLSVRRPVGVVMIVLAILLLGAISLRNLAVDLFPKIDIPIAAVVTSYPGAAPEEVEKMVTRTLEATLSSLEGIDTISSQSQTGSSLIILQFKTGTNLDFALLEVRERIDRVKDFLPDSANSPSILRFDPQQTPVIYLGLDGIEPEDLQSIAEQNVVPYLERQQGVASVNILGGKTFEILVELDRAAMTRYNLTPMQIVQALQTENRSISAGSVVKGQQELQVRVAGEYESVEDIGNTLIHLPNGQSIRLQEVASIQRTVKNDGSYTYVNGKQGLLLEIYKQSDANTVKVSDNVLEAVEELQELLPEKVRLTVIFDNAMFIRQSIDSVLNNMVTGAVLAMGILLLFLRSFRTTLIIGLSIPISIISTFVLMYFTGETLNLITLGGLALGIGMIVDNSIVILENIFSYKQRGLGNKEAAVLGAEELTPAVIAATMTTVVVFVPIIFVQGIAADIFKPMALTVAFSLLASLVVALSLVPMLASKMLPKRLAGGSSDGSSGDSAEHLTDGGSGGGARLKWFDRQFNRVLGVYKRVLRWSLGHRKTIVGGTLAALIGSFALIPLIGMEFMPAADQGMVQVNIRTPTGTPLDETRHIVEQFYEQIEPYQHSIRVTYAFIGGSGGFGAAPSNEASLSLELVEQEKRQISTSDLAEELRRIADGIAGAEITVSQMEMSISTSDPILIRISGNDQEVMSELAQQVIWTISDVEGIVDPQSSSSEANSELNIEVDRAVAAQYGLTYSQILSEIQLAMNGQVATVYREDGNEIDVKVILPTDARSSVEALEGMMIQNARGQIIPLSAVAELKQVKGPMYIQRENQQRQIHVTAGVKGRDLGSVARDVQKALQSLYVPEGYQVTFGGQTDEMMETFMDLGLALMASIFLVYVVMAVQFESLLYPFIMMFSMPTMFIGAAFGLFVTGTPISMVSLIGVIMLAGIVVNNGIILVDYINIVRRRGVERDEAILIASPSRVRPILMTALTTVLGMVPLALGIGEGAETQAPLAITVIFGLLFSTFFTLVFVPVMYTYMDGLSNRFRRLFSWRPFARRRKKSEGLEARM
jgi:HAE1 family hydrophobic/amphiphilic exporter-1